MPSIERPLLSVRQVGRAFRVGERQVLALQPISISAGRGEIIALTGPSGSGKSTLLNLMSGLDRPSTGQVILDGRDLTEVDDRSLAELRNSAFGYVFQAPHMLRNRTVRDNVALPLRYASLEMRRRSEKRVDSLLDYVGLSHFADRTPATLSGGEQQRVVFARALVLDPLVIFADEPTAALDDVNAHLLLTMLADQARERKLVVMATHDPFARAFADREIELSKVTDALG